MEDDVLARVISVEKEIQACIERQRAEAQEWLETVRKEAEEEYKKAEEFISESSQRFLEQARGETIAKAGLIVSGAADKAAKVLQLGSETLSRAVAGRLNMILP